MPLQWPLVGRHDEIELFTATLRDPRAHGFVIYGPPGVGKTRLADQCLAMADAQGRHVARATATEGSSAIPLGALAHLLPADIGSERCDLVAVMSQVRPVLLAGARGGPLVLFVDDLHLLDATSATFVGQLVDADLVFLVATVRTEAALPVGVDALWHRARVRRIDLDDLDRPALDTLLHVVLRGPVEASTIAQVWNASGGNVLFTRELVLGALDGGHLADHHGVWRLVDRLVPTPRLHEVVAARIGALPPPAADALDRLAVWEPTGLSVLERFVGRDQLEVLDRAGLLTVRSDERRQLVTLAHPLYGEILRDRMPRLTRRRLLLELADELESHGARRRGDSIRAATARLEAEGSADPAMLVRAARLARYGHDFVSVERLTRAALHDGMTSEIALMLGEALHEIGSFVEADSVLALAAAAGTDGDELAVYITEIRTRNLMWGLLRPDEALAINRAAVERSGDAGRLELRLNEALLLTYAGRPLDALAVLATVDAGADRRARAVRALAEVPSLVAIGRCATAADAALAAFVEQSELAEQIAIADPGVHFITHIYGLTECGRLAEATALARGAYEAMPASAPPDGAMWLSHQIGRCALLAGQVATAARWLGEALARCDAHNIVGPSRLVMSALATARACLGQRAAAAELVARMDRCPEFGFVRPEQELGRAWALAAAGDLPAARSVLREAAALAARTGYRVTEAWLLHDVARLGDARAAAPRLAALAADCEGDLVAAYADHAAASVAGRPDALVASSERFEQVGARLLAAEAANEAAQAWQREGDGRAATSMGARAATLAASCEGAQTPALATQVMVAPLTPRERDIATLAAQGVSSKAIAEQLFLSVRTVNNHLQNVYTKLGVGSRRHLAAALDHADDRAAAPGSAS